MEFSPSTLGVLLVLAIVLAAGAAMAATVAIQGQRRVRAAYAKFTRGSRHDVIALIERHIDEVRGLRDDVRAQRSYADQLRALLSRTVSRVGTVRYDAFDDMGGRLSFSIALLDEHGDGAVITAMNGRVQTRTYAKPVMGGTSPHNLSEEEVVAIRQALEAPRGKAAVAVRQGGRPIEVDGRAEPPVPLTTDAGDPAPFAPLDPGPPPDPRARTRQAPAPQ